MNGTIPYKGRTISIVQLGLEEDACREVSDVGHRRVYLTDRLGMPLIETVTAPDMRTPQEAAEVADILRRLVRSTGRVRTGAGAARQDVNVSVTGGTWIEIKGFFAYRTSRSSRTTRQCGSTICSGCATNCAAGKSPRNHSLRKRKISPKSCARRASSRSGTRSRWACMFAAFSCAGSRGFCGGKHRRTPTSQGRSQTVSASWLA